MDSFDEYQIAARKTAIYPGKGESLGLAYCALGLGETGEIQNQVKKVIRDDDQQVTLERRDAIVKEMGDVLWYLANMAEELDMNLSEIAGINAKKLADRAARGVLQGSGDNR